MPKRREKIIKRIIIKRDCNNGSGCGICAEACHEGAIGMEDGKAVLLREDYCDGLGDCLPACPADAISFEEREAAPYDAEAVKKHLKERKAFAPPHAGCPGSRAAFISRENDAKSTDQPFTPSPGRLSQWPVQIKLVSVGAPYFNGADLLIAADCTAFAYGSFHEDFIKGRITLIGCPKLDGIDYSEKLAAIISGNDIKSITAVRMQVPCCGGLVNAVSEAIRMSGKDLSLRTVIISPDGMIVGDR